MITLGLSTIKVGKASMDGSKLASDMKKIGKTYKDTAKLSQDQAEVTEHYEEGRTAPEFRKKTKKVPKLVFSIMDPDIDVLVAYVGGTKGTIDTVESWGYDGSEAVQNVSIYVETEQGLDFYIPNADIEAVVDADLSAKGIFLVNFVVTPCSVDTGKAFNGLKKKNAK